jgi:hypothetical protein
MSNLQNQLIDNLERLIGSLAISKNDGPLHFFTYLRLAVLRQENTADLKELIRDEIEKATPIVQYGDFTPEQERLFNQVQKTAEAILGAKI